MSYVTKLIATVGAAALRKQDMNVLSHEQWLHLCNNASEERKKLLERVRVADDAVKDMERIGLRRAIALISAELYPNIQDLDEETDDGEDE